MHYLLWIESGLLANAVDSIISAEIPDPASDPILHDLVTTHMIHGPCGKNTTSPCMDKFKGTLLN